MFNSGYYWDDILVGGDWNMNVIFPYIGDGIIIPIDELIFFRGIGIPPTSYVVFVIGKLL